MAYFLIQGALRHEQCCNQQNKAWFGLFRASTRWGLGHRTRAGCTRRSVPPGTPQSIIDKLAVTVQKIASDAAFRERFAKQGVTVRSSSTQELKEFMEQEARQWTEIIRANNIKS
ncbi:MAG: hypothetical protein EBV89_01980 [Betaproteobacteria bacterium]|nr:hypothetical protein [Betaproteobacteria bacterium]NCW50039.1 hypothetical protein [Betaproteobacteria bacterium]